MPIISVLSMPHSYSSCHVAGRCETSCIVWDLAVLHHVQVRPGQTCSENMQLLSICSRQSAKCNDHVSFIHIHHWAMQNYAII